MTIHLRQVRLALVVSCLLAVPALAADEEGVASTAALIDQHIFDRLRQEQVEPAPPSTDAEFARRVWLDIAGRIPSAARARQFLADSRADKRSRLVEQLLDDTGYSNHFTTYWRNILMPEVQSDEQVRQLLPGFDAWLRQHLAHNTPYDQLVREIITVPLASRGRDAQIARSGEERSPIAFFQAKEIAPENLAAATSRIFLGIRLECAQCHDHPFDHWTQEQFWSYASFFAGIERQGQEGVLGRVEEIFDRRELRIPDTVTVVQASYLDGSDPHWRPGAGSRQILADWITSAGNPYFARMTVNRIWGKFFGVGLVDPVDDFTLHNTCSHPELLETLAERLVAQDFDIKFLIRAITASRAYQLSSARRGEPSDDREVTLQQFASMAVKGLTPDQLLDSLTEASGYSQPFPPRPPSANPPSLRTEILELFANDTDPPTGQQTSILQALALMNGEFVASIVDPQQSRTLADVVNAPVSTAERVESLFFATLSRPPTVDESRRFVEFVQSSGAANDEPRALADVFWALLNSAEFATNH